MWIAGYVLCLVFDYYTKSICIRMKRAIPRPAVVINSFAHEGVDNLKHVYSTSQQRMGQRLSHGAQLAEESFCCCCRLRGYRQTCKPIKQQMVYQNQGIIGIFQILRRKLRLSLYIFFYRASSADETFPIQR